MVMMDPPTITTMLARARSSKSSISLDMKVRGGEGFRLRSRRAHIHNYVAVDNGVVDTDVLNNVGNRWSLRVTGSCRCAEASGDTSQRHPELVGGFSFRLRGYSDCVVCKKYSSVDVNCEHFG